LRPSNNRAPAQVSPYPSNINALARSIDTKSETMPREVTSPRPAAPTIWAAPHHIGARIERFCNPAKTSSAPRSAVTNTVTTESVATSSCMAGRWYPSKLPQT
jgi:hypothetical protein